MQLSSGRRRAALDPAFDAAMASLGPFEADARLAVAVSGGSDSMALALLAARWAARRGATIEAITVDHGLRPESGAEARVVGRWLRARGIAHRILNWTGPHPTAGIQAAARAARYELLTGHCRRRGILHLLLAHQRDDQAETVLMRRAAGSGPDGLAGMAALIERDGVRLLRPLLGLPRSALIEWLAMEGQGYVTDPSNTDRRFLRPRLRQGTSERQRDQALTQARLQGPRRARREAKVARLLAASTSLAPAGHALIDQNVLIGASDDLAVRALGALVATVGGADHRPGPDALGRLLAALRHGRLRGGLTLGGCRIVPWHDRILICREAARVASPIELGAGPGVSWDGRFAVQSVAEAGGALTLRALGPSGLAALRRQDGRVAVALARLAPPARAVIPSLERLDGFLTVPHLDWEGFGSGRGDGAAGRRLAFRPVRSLAEAPFRPAHMAGGVARTASHGV